MRQGIPWKQAARAAGMLQATVEEFLQTPRAFQVIGDIAKLHTSRLVITKELLTLQLYEERARSATAAEGIAALKEIGKVNGLYDKARVSAEVEGQNAVKSRKVLERMSDKDLMQEAGFDFELLPKVINHD